MSIVSLPLFRSKFNKRVFDTNCAGTAENYCTVILRNIKVMRVIAKYCMIFPCVYRMIVHTYRTYCPMFVREINSLLVRPLFGRQISIVQSHTCVSELRFKFKLDIELWNVSLLFT